jgi:small subunit ribosomal protein S4
MGDPKKLRKRYETPRHPWQASRISAEKQLTREYGLKNKKEIWKAQSLLRRFTNQAKALSTIKTEHQKHEKEQLIHRLVKLGLLKEGQDREDVLGLSVKNILDRRLQTLIFKKGLALTPKQARQFIVHGHISVNEQKITIPNYLVNIGEEDKIGYLPTSNLSDKEHPEIALIKEKYNKETREEKELKEIKKTKENKKELKEK